MIRLALLALLFLAACIPTAESAPETVALTCSEGVCALSAHNNITVSEVRLKGAVSSSFCEYAPTPEPTPCKAVQGEWRAISLPYGVYGERVVVARYDMPPADGFALVNVAGERVTFRVELKVLDDNYTLASSNYFIAH